MPSRKTHFKLDETYAYLGWIVLILASGGAIFPLMRIMLFQDGWFGYLFYMLLTIGCVVIASRSIIELGRRRYHITIDVGNQLRIKSYLGEQPLIERTLSYDQINSIRIVPSTERSRGEAWFDFSYGYIGLLNLSNGEEVDLAAGSAKQLQFRVDELQEVADAIARDHPHIKIWSPMVTPPSQLT
jgi:hypothetical protein